MARVIVPIIKLRFAAQDAHPLELHDVFTAAGVWNPEEAYTFTGRVTLDPEDPQTPARKAQIAQKIREVLEPVSAERLLAFLSEHHWDVSFYVDTF